MSKPFSESTRWYLFFLCWLFASVATLGSLFLGEVMGKTPCTLCWYQRIFMYPLPFILTVGMFPFDPRSTRYALPIAITGWGIALYHCLLYWGIIPQSLQPCSQGVSCTDAAKLELFGFVTIPLLSLLGFSLIIALLFAVRKGHKS